MKKIILILALMVVGLSSYSQTFSKLLPGQARPYRGIHPDNILWVDTLASGEFRVWAIKIDSMSIKPVQMKWMQDSIRAVGNRYYPQLTGSYSNPAWVNSLSVA